MGERGGAARGRWGKAARTISSWFMRAVSMLRRAPPSRGVIARRADIAPPPCSRVSSATRSRSRAFSTLRRCVSASSPRPADDAGWRPPDDSGRVSGPA